MGNKKNNKQIKLKNIYQKLIAAVTLLCMLWFFGCGQLISQQNGGVVAPQRIAYLSPQQEADGVIVKFISNTGNNSRARSLRAAGLSDAGSFGFSSRLRKTQVQAGVTINQTLEKLSNDPSVAYAEPNYIYSIEATLPNDADFSLQYGLNNPNDSDIDAPEAWDISIGASSVIVAVIDSGVDYNHPDLRNQIWTNTAEIPGNGVDDDGNGFVDDIRGWDFADNDNDPMDENAHGTHVAGIIGAQGNDNRGAVGVNWAVQIMPLKFMDADGLGSTIAAIQAIDYAVANGARISNNSWGGDTFSQALFDTIQMANSQGHLFVAASGNDGVNTDNGSHFPSNYELPNIISVAASTSNDTLARFSNFGVATVDLAAPGLQIYSTIPNRQYELFSGTSMAAPFVAGVAALLLSKNNSLTTDTLKTTLLDTVDQVPVFEGRLVTGGRLNAFNAIKAISPADPPTPAELVTIAQPQSTTLVVGEALQLVATGGDGNYFWGVSNVNLASITNTTGVATAIAPGPVDIIARDSSGLVSAPLTMDVIAANNTLGFIPADLSSMNLNEVVSVSATGGLAPYRWQVSNANIATLTALGAQQQTARLVASANGSFIITVTDANDNSASSQSIQVNAPELSIIADKSKLTLGESLQLSVTGGTSPYTWSSNNVSVASVNAGGLVTSLKAGIATIRVVDITGASVTIAIEITNPAPAVATLVVTPEQSVIGTGMRVRLRVTGNSTPLAWSSSDPNVARVDARGIVDGLTAGSVEISVSDELGNSEIATVEVRNMTMTASVFTIGAGDTLQLDVIGGVAPYDWSVNNNVLARIDKTGLLSTTIGVVGGVLVTVTDRLGISKNHIITINNATKLREPLDQ